MGALSSLKAKTRTVLVLLAAVVPVVAAASLVRATNQPEWSTLQSNEWARIEIEPALYESPDQARYFNHFRVVNKTGHALALNLNDRGAGWPNLAASNATTVSEGAYRGIVSEWIALPFPFGDTIGRKERNLMLALRAGTASLIPAQGTLDYFIPAQNGTRAQVYRQYGRFLLWMKAKTYWPGAPMPLHLVLVLRGAVSVSDGRTAKTISPSSREFAIPFPLQWKTMPANARIMKNP